MNDCDELQTPEGWALVTNAKESRDSIPTGSPLSMATFHPSSENYAHALCHSTANHRLVLDPVGIGFTILLRLSLTPSLQEFEARHSH